MEDRWLPLKLTAMAVAGFGFAFSLVPLYDAFCDLTGFGGRTNETPVALIESAGDERTITIEFMTTVNQYAPYSFESEVRSMEVVPGKVYDANFVASNLSQSDRVAQAIPSVYPNKAASYLKKTECFCFNNQPFQAGERKDMPVRFMIDRDIPDYIDTITLAYTFFNIENTVAR
ncbi:MAG: cytochrome c oxidase assembly protein [Pseudomonadota bacterium]